jgi:hypothetical protein
MSTEQNFSSDQTKAMKQAFEVAWDAISIQSDPDTAAGQTSRDMLAAIILALANNGEQNPKILCEEALRRLPPSVFHQTRPGTLAEPAAEEE